MIFKINKCIFQHLYAKGWGNLTSDSVIGTFQHQVFELQNQIVSQLKREVQRLREKDEVLEKTVREMRKKDEALEEEVKHLRKDVEEQLMSVAKFLPSPCQHGKPFYENHFKYVTEL